MIEAVNKIIETVAILPIKREQIELLNTHINLLKERLEFLEKENQTLKTENSMLKAKKQSDEFKDFGKFLLKSNNKGAYFDTPFCPTCKKPLSDFSDANSYVCDSLSCGSYSINFKNTKEEIATFLANLAK